MARAGLKIKQPGGCCRPSFAVPSSIPHPSSPRSVKLLDRAVPTLQPCLFAGRAMGAGLLRVRVRMCDSCQAGSRIVQFNIIHIGSNVRRELLHFSLDEAVTNVHICFPPEHCRHCWHRNWSSLPHQIVIPKLGKYHGYTSLDCRAGRCARTCPTAWTNCECSSRTTSCSRRGYAAARSACETHLIAYLVLRDGAPLSHDATEESGPRLHMLESLH